MHADIIQENNPTHRK